MQLNIPRQFYNDVSKPASKEWRKLEDTENQNMWASNTILDTLKHYALAIPLILDGTFYVWLEYVSLELQENAEPSYWISSMLVFFGIALFSGFLAYRREKMGMTSSSISIMTIQTYPLWSIQGFLKTLHSMLYDAHLISGVLASLSYLGSFQGDSRHIYSSNQAKWQHTFAIPLFVLCTSQPVISRRYWSFISVIAIIVAFCMPVDIRDPSSNMSKDTLETYLMALCPISVSLASPILILNGVMNSTFIGTFKALFTITVFTIFQWKLQNRDAFLAPINHPYTWPLLLVSAFMLVQGRSSVKNQKSALFQLRNGCIITYSEREQAIADEMTSGKDFENHDYFLVGIHLTVLIMGIFLSSSPFLVRVMITLLIGVLRILEEIL